jgi:hypothetical protein
MDKLLKTVVAVVLFPLLLPVVLLALATYALHGAALYVMVWTVWCLRGKHVLLVYSESPVWLANSGISAADRASQSDCTPSV